MTSGARARPEAIPSFTTVEEAAEFWDFHSLADYWHMKEVVASAEHLARPATANSRDS